MKALQKSLTQLHKSHRLIMSFCTKQLIKNGKLSPQLERALWAQAYINIILERPTSLEEVMKCSLHQKLLNLQKPFPEHFVEYQFDESIKQEMRSYFLINQGVALPRNIYDQARFNNARNKNGRVSFYPTYSTTRHMFRRVFQQYSLLIYGRWGIGKSMSLILCSMLSNIIYNLYKKNVKEFRSYQHLLKLNMEVIYWSINESQYSKQQFARKLLYQRKWLWPKLGVGYTDFEDLADNINNLPQQQNEKVFSKLTRFETGSNKIIMDQINILASLKRRYNLRSGTKQQKQKLLKKIQNIDKLKQSLEANTQVLYNSSVNIEQELILGIKQKRQSPRLMLGDENSFVSRLKFDREQRQAHKTDNEIKDFNSKLTIIQLSQIFTNLIQEYAPSAPSKQKILQAQCKFQLYQWSFHPNSLIISEQIRIYFGNQQGRAHIWDNIDEILQEISKNGKIAFFNYLQRYLSKQHQQQQQRSEKQKQQKQFDQNKSLTIQLIEQAIKQSKKQNKKNIKNKINCPTKISFQVRMPIQVQLSPYDKHIFSYRGKKIEGKNKKFHVFQCLVSPQFFIQAYSIAIFLRPYKQIMKMKEEKSPQQIKQLKEQIKQQVKQHANQNSTQKQKKELYLSIIGRMFESCLIYLLRSGKFDIYFKSENYARKLEQFVQINNIKGQTKKEQTGQGQTSKAKAGKQKISLQQQLKNAKSIIKSSIYTKSILCIPHQFKKILEKFKNAQKIKNLFLNQKFQQNQVAKKNNKAFDFLVLTNFSKTQMVYQFFDITISKGKTLTEKYSNFLKLLLSMKQFSSFQASKKLPENIVQAYRGKIQFVIFGLQNQKQNPICLENSNEKQFAKLLQISMTIISISQKALFKRNLTPLESNSVQSYLYDRIYVLAWLQDEESNKDNEGVQKNDTNI